MKRAQVGAFTAAVLALLLSASHASAADSTSAAQDQIRAELEKWTRDFNGGDASDVCSLFAPDLISNFRGEPEDTYNSCLLYTSIEPPAAVPIFLTLGAGVTPA